MALFFGFPCCLALSLDGYAEAEKYPGRSARADKFPQPTLRRPLVLRAAGALVSLSLAPR
jgi:hypothetical protein